MRFGAELPSAKFALLSRPGTACRTTDSEYLFGAEFSFHAEIMPQTQLLKWSILTSHPQSRTVNTAPRQNIRGRAIANILLSLLVYRRPRASRADDLLGRRADPSTTQDVSRSDHSSRPAICETEPTTLQLYTLPHGGLLFRISLLCERL
jgi:hypothetical protein